MRHTDSTQFLQRKVARRSPIVVNNLILTRSVVSATQTLPPGKKTSTQCPTDRTLISSESKFACLPGFVSVRIVPRYEDTPLRNKKKEVSGRVVSWPADARRQSSRHYVTKGRESPRTKALRHFCLYQRQAACVPHRTSVRLHYFLSLFIFVQN